MTFEITLTPENHGYTIRLEKRSFVDGGKKEVSETVATLAIIWNQKTAFEVFNGLNSLLCVCARESIIDENLFRFRGRKE